MSENIAGRYVIFRFVPDGAWQFISLVKEFELENAKKKILELNAKDDEEYLIQDVLLGLTIASTKKKMDS